MRGKTKKPSLDEFTWEVICGRRDLIHLPGHRLLGKQSCREDHIADVLRGKGGSDDVFGPADWNS